MVTLHKNIVNDKKAIIGTAETNVCKYCGRWDCKQMNSERAHTYIGDGKWVIKHG